MDEQNISEYLSAFADKGTSDLTPGEIEQLQQLVHERPEYFGEYQLNLATKLCLIKHLHPVCCPRSTADSIRDTIALMYNSRRAAL